jgi:hypothetical protein
MSVREQQVIIKNEISGNGNLKAGYPGIVFMWFDHFQSALKVIPKCL